MAIRSMLLLIGEMCEWLLSVSIFGCGKLVVGSNTYFLFFVAGQSGRVESFANRNIFVRGYGIMLANGGQSA